MFNRLSQFAFTTANVLNTLVNGTEQTNAQTTEAVISDILPAQQYAAATLHPLSPAIDITSIANTEYHPIRPPSHTQPLEAKNANQFSLPVTTQSSDVPKSANEVEIATEIATQKTYYLKYSEKNSFMAELEVAAYWFYRYFSPDIIARSAHPLYEKHRDNSIHYIGSISEDIGEDNIAEDELPDSIKSERAAQMNKSGEPLAPIKSIRMADKSLSAKDLDDSEQGKLIKQDLADISSLADIGAEDDLHKGNILWYKKQGFWRLARIDFDMSHWPIHYQHKNYQNSLGMVGATINQRWRTMYIDTYKKADGEKIANLPDYSGNAHYYWFTKTSPVTSTLANLFTSTSTSGKHSVSKSDKSWTDRDANLFKQLKTDPHYVFCKYKNYLQWVLTDATFLQQLDRLCIRQTLYFERKNILEIRADYFTERLNQYKNCLADLPSFAQFLKNDGEKAFEMIKLHISKLNTEFRTKAKKHFEYNDLVIDIPKMTQRYQQLCHIVSSKHTPTVNIGDSITDLDMRLPPTPSTQRH